MILVIVWCLLRVHNWYYLSINTGISPFCQCYTIPMQDAKEEVRSRLAIEDVVGEYVELKRSGRNFKGLSPFTGERTASFFVSPEKNIWHDFSSGQGGDIFTFIMTVEGMTFRESLEYLARKAGVDMSLYQSSAAQKIGRKKKRLEEANELAAHYYQYCLVKNQHALEYVFKKRQLDKAVVSSFRIGYAPDDSYALVNYLSKKGFSKQEISEAGLSNRFDGDLFKGRMMIPLTDPSGRVIGFTGRIIKDDPNAPKYLNTPQTLLYDKSWHVFGFSQAKQSIRKKDYAVIVEGNLDVVSSHQFGVEEVVAAAGTALTFHHLKTVARSTSNIRLAFDGDKAGLSATERAIPLAQQAGVNLTIVTIPGDSQDPDDVIRDDVKLWQAAIASHEPAIDWVLGKYEGRLDMTSAAGKKEFTDSALEVIKAVQDPVEKEYYYKKIADMASTSLESLRAKESSTATSEKKKLKPVIEQQQADINMALEYEYNLLSLALKHVEVQKMFAASDVKYLTSEESRVVLKYVVDSSGVVSEVPQDLQKYQDYVNILLLRAETRYAGWKDQDILQESQRLLRRIKDEHKKQKKTELDIALREAEESEDYKKAREIMQQIQSLNKEIHR